MEKEKSCFDCWFYLQYYIKEKGKFAPISLGHCKNKSKTGTYRKTDKICEHFKERSKEDEKKWQVISTKKYLFEINKKMDELTQIFKVK